MPTPLQQRFYEFGHFQVDCGRRLLMRGGEPVPLTPKAFEILLVLIQNRDRVMEKDEMMRLVWPGTVVEENNLTRNISNLRKALGEGPNDHRFIVTVPGRGYQFAGEASEAASHTEVVLERRARVLIEEQSETETDTAPRTVPMGIAEPKSQRRTGLRLVVAAATCLLLAASGWLYVSERRQATLPTPRVVPVTALPDSVWCSSISPDGNYVAFARHSDSPELSGVWVKQVGSENYTQLTRNAGDICPAWSPDGRSLTFSRYADQQRFIFLISLLGGAERRLFSGAPAAAGMNWSPDSRYIAFCIANPQPDSYSIAALATDTFEIHKLTEPPAGYQDWDPTYSPDGKQMAFVRWNGSLTSSEVYVMNADGGNSRRLTFDNSLITSPPIWSRNGEAILFSSARAGLPAVWRVSAQGGSLSRVTELGIKALRPTLSADGRRLAYELAMGTSSIWSFNVEDNSRRVVTASKGSNQMPQFSPDGAKIALVSDRAGTDEIYTCDADGSNLLQLTHLGTARTPGNPRWSHDSQRIAFDAMDGGHTSIFVMQANGGAPRPLGKQTGDSINPTWSRDGQWIYFSSNRTGSWQMWRMPSDGGEAVQLTQQGGFIGYESADGKTLYYANTAANPDIWKLRLEDSQEAAVTPALHLPQSTAWALTDKGIFFVPEAAESHPVLHYLDFGTGRMRELATLQKQPWRVLVSASPDGKRVLFQQQDMWVSNVMLVENFR